MSGLQQFGNVISQFHFQVKQSALLRNETQEETQCFPWCIVIQKYQMISVTICLKEPRIIKIWILKSSLVRLLKQSIAKHILIITGTRTAVLDVLVLNYLLAFFKPRVLSFCYLIIKTQLVLIKCNFLSVSSAWFACLLFTWYPIANYFMCGLRDIKASASKCEREND